MKVEKKFQLLKNRSLLYCVAGFVIVLLTSTLIPLFRPQDCNQNLCPFNLQSSIIDILSQQFQQSTMTFLFLLWLILPLLAAVIMLLIAVLYVLRQREGFLQWFFLMWAIGLLPFSMLYVFNSLIYHPYWSFLGIVMGYILFFVGFNQFLSKKK